MGGQGRIQDFHLGGPKRLCARHARYEFLMLSSAIWALFVSIQIYKMGLKKKKKKTVHQLFFFFFFFGGGGGGHPMRAL